MRDRIIARVLGSPQLDWIEDKHRSTIDRQFKLCETKSSIWVFKIGQRNSRHHSWRRPTIFSQSTRTSSSFLSLSFRSNRHHHCWKCFVEVLRMEQRQLKLKTRNPVGQKCYQQLEGTSSHIFKLSVLSWRKKREKVFGRSIGKQQSVAERQQLIVSKLSIFILYSKHRKVFMEEAGRWIATIIFQYFSEVAKIHVISEWVSQSSNIRKWRENVEAIFRLGGNFGV